MKALFVIGTDTDVGKTLISGLLARFLLSRGYRVVTQKWVQSGVKKFHTDIDEHLRLMGKERKDFEYYLPHMSQYIFKFASSPHLASRLERRRISPTKIKHSFRFLTANFDFVIVEGIGGSLVPFNEKKLVIDIAEELALPVLIVVGNRLGAINHALLTVEAIKRRNMEIIGIIFNNIYKKVDKILLRDNIDIIKKLTRERILGVLPWEKNKDTLYKAFIPIGERIVKYESKASR